MRVFTTWLFLTVLGVAVVAAEDQPKLATDVFKGDEVLATVQKPERVEVFRLKDATLEDAPDKYEITAGPLDVTDETARQLARVLLAHDSYEREVQVGCEPLFGVRVKFVRGKSTVDVTLCYACDILVVYHDGKRVGDGLFLPARKELRRLAKEMLPEDKAIQALK